MKTNCYKLLFRIFAFLSDRTNGASLFVKYKLIFGTILIGIASGSCTMNQQTKTGKNSTKDTLSCVQDSIDNTERDTMITCYEPIAPPDSSEIQQDATNPEDESIITCYLPDLPTKTE